MRTFLLLLLATALLVSPAYGQFPSIFLEADHCLSGPGGPFNLQLPGFQPIPIEIRAHAPLGAQAFEFSIPGFTLATGIVVTDLIANPAAASAAGNPFAEGAKISFATCQSATVTLYTATLFVLAPSASVYWSVAPHSSPSVPGTTCPTAGLCGGGSAACIIAQVPQQHAIPPSNPSPADGATDVPLDPTLLFNWQSSGCGCAGVPCVALYFGVDPDPPLFFSQCDIPFPALHLEPSTTYYWRVDATFCGPTFHGPVWSFTTVPPLGAEATTWSNVKMIFR
jgi:hypothetical protein